MRAKIFKGTALVVSSNERFKRPLHSALSRGGYSIRLVVNQEEGLQELRRLNPTIVIVDRMESGFAQLHHALPDHTPVLTVLNHPGLCDEHHCILDLEDGAARAICNAGPFVIAALADAVLRRQRWQQPAPGYFTADEVTIDFANNEVKVGTNVVSITPTQFRILKSLVAAPGHFLSRQALLDKVWGEGFAICAHTLDVNLSLLRRTLHSHGTSPDFIVTLKGVGFKLRSTRLLEQLPLCQPPQQFRGRRFQQPALFGTLAEFKKVSDTVQRPGKPTRSGRCLHVIELNLCHPGPSRL